MQGRWLFALLAGMSPEAGWCAQGSGVRIEARVDASGHQYSWTVTNEHAPAAITLVEIPHHRADLFLAPDSWDVACTNLVGAGAGGESGTCVVSVKHGFSGILTGQSVPFEMRVSPKGARRGNGTVVIGLANGIRTTITNVTLPVPQAGMDKYASLIGLAVIFAGFLAAQVLKKRRARAGNQNRTADGDAAARGG